nr:MAG TPA: hypothetical protein [Caudoviricetes sp.]DAN25075.1 MAG TPA: hypothetical protein [Caudoviricetes sp.]DAT99407.1 MAG TPA: hypothetical protein [Caudoviricetes sp.]
MLNYNLHKYIHFYIIYCKTVSFVIFTIVYETVNNSWYLHSSYS